MAKTVESFEFRSRTAGTSHYDWASWLNGEVWQLVEGEDFECKPSTVRMMALNAAKRRKLGVRVSVNSKDGVVHLQAYAKDLDNEANSEQDDGEQAEGNGIHEAEKQDREQFKKLTIKKLKALLDENTVPYPADADKATLMEAAFAAGL